MKKGSLSKGALTSLTLMSLTFSSVFAQQSKVVGITNFSGIHVSSGIDLYLTQSSLENIKVSANPDLLKNVLVEKQGTIVNISYKNNIRWGNTFKGQSIKVYMSFKTLQAISASGGSDVYGQNTIKSSDLKLDFSGGSDLKLELQTKNLNVESSGGSDLSLKGSSTNLVVNISGGSDLDAFDLKADYAKVNASGSSDANINVTKGLQASATGGSDIHYKGDAALNVTSSSKSGEVQRVN
jgi:hypothetical protein